MAFSVVTFKSVAPQASSPHREQKTVAKIVGPFPTRNDAERYLDQSISASVEQFALLPELFLSEDTLDSLRARFSPDGADAVFAKTPDYLVALHRAYLGCDPSKTPPTQLTTRIIEHISPPADDGSVAPPVSRNPSQPDTRAVSPIQNLDGGAARP